MAAWLRKGEIEAREIECSPYRKKTFAAVLQKIRSLTVEGQEVFIPKMQSLCAQAGVAVVFVPELPKCRASGAARWLNRGKALVQLSFRYKTNDHLWFTFFHEAAHVLRGDRNRTFIDEFGSRDLASEEEYADRFAADIRPPAGYRRFTDATQGADKSEGSLNLPDRSMRPLNRCRPSAHDNLRAHSSQQPQSAAEMDYMIAGLTVFGLSLGHVLSSGVNCRCDSPSS